MGAKSKHFLTAGLMAAVLLTVSFGAAAAPVVFDKQAHATARAVFDAFDSPSSVYAHRARDDAQAQEVFELFLANLDPQRLLVTQPELDALRPSSKALWAGLRGKDLAPLASAYDQWEALGQARLAKAKALVAQDLDWAAPGALPLLAGPVGWKGSEEELTEAWRQVLKRRWLEEAAKGLSAAEIRAELLSGIDALEIRLNRRSSTAVLTAYLNAFAQSFDPHSAFRDAAGADRLDNLLGASRGPLVEGQQRFRALVWDVDGQKVGMVRFPSFYADMDAYSAGNLSSLALDVSRALEEFKATGVAAVVVDLRGNGGGLIQQAVELAGLFLDRGPVARLRFANGAEQDLLDTRPGMVWDGPLGVLVDQNTASASEIFAAAIQDHGRGIVVGEPTYGKGTGQTTTRLPAAMGAAGLSITSLQVFRTTGASTQQAGVTPDVSFEVTLAGRSRREEQMHRAIAFAQTPPSLQVVSAPWGSRLSEINAHCRQRMEASSVLGRWEADAVAYRTTKQDASRIQSIGSAAWENGVLEQASRVNQAAITGQNDFLGLEAARIVLDARPH